MCVILHDVFECVYVCEGGRWLGVNVRRWVFVRVIRSVSFNVWVGVRVIVGVREGVG